MLVPAKEGLLQLARDTLASRNRSMKRLRPSMEPTSSRTSLTSITMLPSHHREEPGTDQRMPIVGLAASRQVLGLVSCQRIEGWARRSHQINTDWRVMEIIIIIILVVIITVRQMIYTITIRTQ